MYASSYNENCQPPKGATPFEGGEAKAPFAKNETLMGLSLYQLKGAR